MPQSLVKLYVHIIFSTKNRRPLIDQEIENALYSYLGGICNGLECFPVKIGGHKDHVHILSHFSKKITMIKFLEELKSHSSNWIKTQNTRYKDFYWQGGYGAFSVSPQSIEPVKQYIESQHEHHKTTTFQDEYRRILREHNVEFDERYVWD
jgi:REP element-mobilizing transposase RayT